MRSYPPAYGVYSPALDAHLRIGNLLPRRFSAPNGEPDPLRETTFGRELRSTALKIAQRLFLDRSASFVLDELGTTRSLRELRARVVKIIDETPDIKTFVLEANRHWRGHRAGQYVTVDVELDGVRHRRCYSLTSASSDQSSRRLSIAVKRVPGGRVSTFLHERVRPGAVLNIGHASGDFVLDAEPSAASQSLLLLSGGSGVTPVLSILRDLDARDAVGDVVFVHYARRAIDVAFWAELLSISRRRPGLRLELCLDEGDDGSKGFTEEGLMALVPDYASRHTLLCGPSGLMARVERMWAQRGLTKRLKLERFGSPAPLGLPTRDGPVKVRLTGPERTRLTSGRGSLLAQLEAVGERPAFGCRAGICHTCTCTKRSGTVMNLLTGLTSSRAGEAIQLCVSAAMSDLHLELQETT